VDTKERLFGKIEHGIERRMRGMEMKRGIEAKTYVRGKEAGSGSRHATNRKRKKNRELIVFSQEARRYRKKGGEAKSKDDTDT